MEKLGIRANSPPKPPMAPTPAPAGNAPDEQRHEQEQASPVPIYPLPPTTLPPGGVAEGGGATAADEDPITAGGAEEDAGGGGGGGAEATCAVATAFALNAS